MSAHLICLPINIYSKTITQSKLFSSGYFSAKFCKKMTAFLLWATSSQIPYFFNKITCIR
ncbi:hypothetical protein appser4_19360 [Actinobacillus pleuropneumoniae serovar 4 str. M62]|nr:hypothetical protein appser4_19360 [Actinobacillus pleuropneumoniae serovar 4 str. M62]